MFVLTVDHIDSRHAEEDAVLAVLDQRADWSRRGAVLGPDRTVGDEFQLVFDSAPTALDAALLLRRHGRWSVGVGVGDVQLPMPTTTGAARGNAFLRARTAIDSAKRSVHRLVVVGHDPVASEGVTALIGLLLEVRMRRTAEGWQVADLCADDLSQAAIAERLGITPQAVSLRVRAAALRVERAALPALVAGLAALDS